MDVFFFFFIISTRSNLSLYYRERERKKYKKKMMKIGIFFFSCTLTAYIVNVYNNILSRVNYLHYALKPSLKKHHIINIYLKKKKKTLVFN